jgi:hypothetical protein
MLLEFVLSFLTQIHQTLPDKTNVFLYFCTKAFNLLFMSADLCLFKNYRIKNVIPKTYEIFYIIIYLIIY